MQITSIYEYCHWFALLILLFVCAHKPTHTHRENWPYRLQYTFIICSYVFISDSDMTSRQRGLYINTESRCWGCYLWKIQSYIHFLHGNFEQIRCDVFNGSIRFSELIAEIYGNWLMSSICMLVMESIYNLFIWSIFLSWFRICAAWIDKTVSCIRNENLYTI